MSKVEKIVFVVNQQFWERDWHRFGGEYFVSRGHDVEVWRIMSKNSFNLETQAKMYSGDNYHEYTIKEFDMRIKNREDYVFISMDSWADHTLLLSKRKCRYILLGGLGPVLRPEYNYSNADAKGFVQKMKGRLKAEGTKKFTEITLNNYRRKVKKTFRKSKPILVVTSTRYGGSRFFSKDELENNVLYVHAGDYDSYLEVERTEPLNEAKHILYCDSGYENLDYDGVLSGKIDRNAVYSHRSEYFDQLENLFLMLENHYKVPVVISGHPHARYEKGVFHGRDIIFGKTCELAKNAVAFLVNSPTAMNFAEIYDIPTLKIANKYFKFNKYPHVEYSNAYDFIRWEADELGVCFMDMDNDEMMQHPWDYIKPIDPQKRQEYLIKYVIDGDMKSKTIYEYIEEYISRLE